MDKIRCGKCHAFCFFKEEIEEENPEKKRILTCTICKEEWKEPIKDGYGYPFKDMLGGKNDGGNGGENKSKEN